MSVGFAPAVASSALARAPTRMLVGGDWVDASSGKTFTDVDPSSGEALAEVPSGSAADVDRAVAAARAATTRRTA